MSWKISTAHGYNSKNYFFRQAKGSLTTNPPIWTKTRFDETRIISFSHDKQWLLFFMRPPDIPNKDIVSCPFKLKLSKAGWLFIYCWNLLTCELPITNTLAIVYKYCVVFTLVIDLWPAVVVDLITMFSSCDIDYVISCRPPNCA